MKKFAICLFMTVLSLTLIPLQLNATVKVPSSIVAPVSSDAAEAKTLELRLNEISAMNKKGMEASEKKSLRKEVKTIKHRLREVGGGVYLSAGVIILIVVLIVVLV